MLQADPFVQASKNSQSLNRYTYVLNNPLSFTDPSGYFVIELITIVFAVVRVIYTWEDPSAWVYLAVAAKNLFSDEITAKWFANRCIGRSVHKYLCHGNEF